MSAPDGETSGRAAPELSCGGLLAGMRRQITVMFVDLTDYTGLSSTLDPEDLTEIIRDYHGIASREIARLDGVVGTLMGDGVLAYFGYPHAHEDDVERAICAGLAILAAVPGISSPTASPLRARVGIATGLVVIGGSVGSPTAEITAVGETPSLAARLQEAARPGTIVVADASRRLVRRQAFEYQDLGELALKGFARCVHAWRVVRTLGSDRSASRPAQFRTPLYGRTAELDRFGELWRKAAGGRGQLAMVVGEAGIGKSRLVREAYRRLVPSPAHRGWCQCSPFHRSTPLYPIGQAIIRAAGLADDVTAEERLDRLERFLAPGTSDVRRVAPLVGDLLDLASDGRYPPQSTSIAQRRDQTLAALVERVLHLANSGPVVIVLEDLQWADASTLELLERLYVEMSSRPVLILATFRPQFGPRWSDLDRATTFHLGRLDAACATAMVDEIARTLSAKDVERVVERADGVPLFIEELAGALAGTTVEGTRSPREEVPATLNDALAARLDQLPEARDVALTAACLGREFDGDVLSAVSPLPPHLLASALRRLVDAGILFCRGRGACEAYRFKHALVRDAAYAMLLRRQRRQLHARIAEALTTRFAARAQAQPELLAHHCTEAGLLCEATDHRRAAGLRAASRGAMEEAATQLRLGLDLVVRLNDPRESVARELELQVALGGVLIALKGEAAPEIHELYRRASELATQTGNTAVEAAVLWGLWHNSTNRGELARARVTVEEQLRCARRTEATLPLAVAHRCGLVVDLFSGRPLDCLAGLARLLALTPPDERSSGGILLDPWTSGRSIATWAWAITGEVARARAEGRRALAEADAARQPYLRAVVLHHLNVLAQLLGDLDDLEERTSELLALTREHGFAHWHATTTVLRGWLTAVRGDPGDGLAAMRQGLAAKVATGSRLKLSYYRGLMAGILGRQGQTGQAAALVAEAIDQVNGSGERWYLPELLRVRAELHRTNSGDLAAAEADLHEAIAVAKGQSAGLWELRARRELAELGSPRRERERSVDGPERERAGPQEQHGLPPHRKARALSAGFVGAPGA